MKPTIDSLYYTYRLHTTKLKIKSLIARFIPNRYFDKFIESAYADAKVVRGSLYLMSGACEGLSESWRNWLKEHGKL